MVRVWFSSGILVVVLVLAACGSSATPAPVPSATSAVPSAAATPTAPAATPTAPAATPTPSPASDQVDAGLMTAIRYLGPGARSLFYTDWTAVLGEPPALVSERLAALVDRTRDAATAAPSLMARARNLRETWGFDLFDLAWQSESIGDGPPVTVLQFRDGYDLGPLIALLEQREFTRSDRGPASVFSHPLDLSEPWMTVVLAMTNVAVDPAGRRIVLSTSPDVVEGALAAAAGAAAPAESGSPRYRAEALAAALGEPYAVQMEVGGTMCKDIAGEMARTGALPPGLASLGRTTGTAVAVANVAGPPAARVAMLYDDPAVAARDLAGRADLATGISARTKEPYATSVMALSNGRVAGSALVFDAAPRLGRANLPLIAMQTRDLPFAACP